MERTTTDLFKKIGMELNQEEREYFKDVITGYPPQVIYCADLAKEMGIEYVKKNTYQLVSNVTGNVTRILETAITGDDVGPGYGLLSFMSMYGLVPVSILHKIFESRPIYQELFHHFRSLTICRYIGSAREYAEVNPVIGDYIQRNNYELPKDIQRILSQELECFSEKLTSNPNIADEEDFESLRFYLKEALKDGQDIPQKFLYSTIYLQSIFELYNSQKYVYNFEFDFFRSIIAIIVVDLQINIKIIANICLWDVSHHITPITSHEIKAKSKIIPKQILGPFYNSNQVVFDWGTFFSGNIFKVVHIVSPYILFSRPDHLA